jgi:hypothetical protein
MKGCLPPKLAHQGCWGLGMWTQQQQQQEQQQQSLLLQQHQGLQWRQRQQLVLRLRQCCRSFQSQWCSWRRRPAAKQQQCARPLLVQHRQLVGQWLLRRQALEQQLLGKQAWLWLCRQILAVPAAPSCSHHHGGQLSLQEQQDRRAVKQLCLGPLQRLLQRSGSLRSLGQQQQRSRSTSQAAGQRGVGQMLHSDFLAHRITYKFAASTNPCFVDACAAAQQRCMVYSRNQCGLPCRLFGPLYLSAHSFHLAT